MSVWEWIRFAVGAALILSGLFVCITAVIGNYRFHFVLNRMHAAGLADTMGLALLFAGAAVFSGWTAFTLKLGLILLFLWCTGPVASHLLVRTELCAGDAAHVWDEEVSG